MHPILFKIGPLTIYTYGVFIAAAFFLGIGLAMKQAKREKENPEKILDLGLYVVISAIIGSRIFFIITNYREYFQEPWRIVKIWEGGLVFYGGLIFAIITAIIFLKKNKMPVWKIADIIAPSLPIGQAVGRLGCFFAGCCYGKPTNLPWAVTFTNPNTLALPGIPLHPTQLYSSLNGLIIFTILIIMRNRKTFDGQLFWSYTLLYSIGRFIIELFRGDERGFVFNRLLSPAQTTGIALAIISIFMLFKLCSLRKKS